MGDLHCRLLKGSMVEWFGARYASALYAYLCGSAQEAVLRVHRDGHIVACCVVSFSPTSLSKRLFFNTPLLKEFPFALLRMPLANMMRTQFGGMFDAKRRGRLDKKEANELKCMPEVVWIFVDEAYQGCGIGRELLELAEAEVILRGNSSYIVKTSEGDTSGPKPFYQRLGFSARHKVQERGSSFLVMVKSGLRPLNGNNS